MAANGTTCGDRKRIREMAQRELPGKPLLQFGPGLPKEKDTGT